MSNPELCGETILILANAEWDWSNRVNCHHLAARLAEKNRVLFVDTVGGRTPAPREMGKIARRLRRILGGVRSIAPGLRVLSPLVLPLYGHEGVRRLNTALLAFQIRRALGGKSRPILWIFLPSLVGLVGRLDEKLVIYHCVDDHAANPRVPARQVKAWEQVLLHKADLVFATSETLYQDKRPFNAHTFYLPNVADVAHFAASRDPHLPVAEPLERIPHPIAGFVGNISAYKLDLGLLALAAKNNSEWSFVFVGPIGRGDPSTDVAPLRALPNVHFMGEQPFSELPRWVKGFDACLIPFQRNESTRGSLPMKFFEYLAAGKPVIATDLASLREFRDYFIPANGAAEYSDALAAALKQDPQRLVAQTEIAARYSWDARMAELVQIVGTALAERTGQ